MTIQMTLHSRYGIGRKYQSRKDGGTLTSIDDCIDSSPQGIKDYIKKSKERLITLIIEAVGI